MITASIAGQSFGGTAHDCLCFVCSSLHSAYILVLSRFLGPSYSFLPLKAFTLTPLTRWTGELSESKFNFSYWFPQLAFSSKPKATRTTLSISFWAASNAILPPFACLLSFSRLLSLMTFKVKNFRFLVCDQSRVTPLSKIYFEKDFVSFVILTPFPANMSL